MIPRERFLASKSEDETAWLEARRGGVTATEVSTAATPAGFRDALEQRRNPTPVEVNAYMAFGLLWEDWIADKVVRDYQIYPNDWLIAGEDRRHLATPDGLSKNHEIIGEYKTTGKDWETVENLPIKYRRQVQWQLHVTGADMCIVAWLLRVEEDGGFVPGWWKPKFGILHRDQEMIDKLVDVAGRLIGESDGS
jgi:predicted phage-related endonuclease